MLHKVLLTSLLFPAFLLTAEARVVAIASGYWHNIALRDDGSVVAWGSSSTAQGKVPTGVSGISAITAGGRSNCVVRQNGTLFWWGDLDGGVDAIPSGLSGVKAVAGGGYHYLALKSDSTVVGWGDNENQDKSTVIPSALKAISIDAGPHYSAALKSNGTVVTWGGEGHAGTVPSGLTDVAAIACGRYHMLALKKDGSVVAWGTTTNLPQIQVPSGLKAKAIGASFELSMAVKLDGTLAVWGRDPNGQRPPSGLSNLVAATGGFTHAIALRADGSMVAWGENTNGQCNIPSSITGIAASPHESFDLTVLPADRIAPDGAMFFDLNGRLSFSGTRTSVPHQSPGIRIDMFGSCVVRGGVGE